MPVAILVRTLMVKVFFFFYKVLSIYNFIYQLVSWQHKAPINFAGFSEQASAAILLLPRTKELQLSEQILNGCIFFLIFSCLILPEKNENKKKE